MLLRMQIRDVPLKIIKIIRGGGSNELKLRREVNIYMYGGPVNFKLGVGRGCNYHWNNPYHDTDQFIVYVLKS